MVPFRKSLQITLITGFDHQAQLGLQRLNPSLILRLATFNFRLRRDRAFARSNVADAVTIERFRVRQRCDAVVTRIQTFAQVMQVLIQSKPCLQLVSNTETTHPTSTPNIIQDVLCFQAFSHPDRHDSLLDFLPHASVQPLELFAVDSSIEQQLSFQLLGKLAGEMQVSL